VGDRLAATVRTSDTDEPVDLLMHRPDKAIGAHGTAQGPA
jgi:hypothetical protein